MRHVFSLFFSLLIFGTQANAQCGTFDSAPNGQEALEAHSLYRELYKQGKYKEAFPLWEKAYSIAPAANGKTARHFNNGVSMYTYFLQYETDEAKKKDYVNKIMALYEQHIQCFPEDKADVMGRRAVKCYYNIEGYDRKKIYDDATASVNALGNKTDEDVLYPLACAAVSLYKSEDISEKDARSWHDKLNQITDFNIENAKKEDDKKKYEEVKALVNHRFEDIATAIFDCNYFKAELLPLYEEDPNDYETIKSVRAQLIQGGCTEADELVAELTTKMVSHISEVNKENAEKRWENLPNANKGAKFLKEGDYNQAIKFYEMAISESAETDKKGDYHYAIAQAYFKMKNYSNARENARLAAKYKPNWGKPYLLIGSLYASSTRSCGDAFEGRMVVIAAIEKYSYAKSVDPEVAEDANRKIARLSGSLPTAEDAFLRGLKDGQSYKVGCWIQENVTIRTMKGY